eukprot:6172695-Pleurochrysis_carterae.AAC.2
MPIRCVARQIVARTRARLRACRCCLRCAWRVSSREARGRGHERGERCLPHLLACVGSRTPARVT